MAKKGEHHEEVSEKSSEDLKIGKFFSKNYWMIATVILAVLLIGVLAFNYSGVASKAKIESAITSFVEDSMGVAPNITSIEAVKNGSLGKLYVVSGDVQGQPFQVYVSKGGDYLLSVTSLKVETATDTPSTQTTTIQKTDKPVLEAFVSPYCPYGLQYIKGLIPAYGLLKSKADIKIRLLSPTHMAEEQPEIVKELCIQDVYGDDVYFEFLRNVVYDSVASECYNVYHGVNLQTGASMPASVNTKNGTYFTTCMSKVNDAAMVKVKIDKAKITSCVSSKGDTLYQNALKYNQNYNVGGSPSPFIGGVALSGTAAGRSPEAIKTAICSAFNNAPSECSTTLSTTTYSPGIGISTQTEGTVPSSVCG